MFGQIQNPFCTFNPRLCSAGQQGQGLIILLNSFIKLLIIVAALYTFLNLILAGYGFMSANGDQKAVAKAWEKIWQSLIGLIVIVGSFVLAAIFGYLIFGPTYWNLLFSPVIFAP